MNSSCCAVLALLLAMTCVHLQCSHCIVFLEESTSVTITEGDTAAFRCRVNASIDAIGWRVNETSLNLLTIPDIKTNSSVPQVGGPRIYILTIVGQSAYNTTSVQCFATFIDTEELHNSNVSELLIQGPLASVTDLTAVSSESAISLTWDAPYSLNLSYFQVDILYCVEVCRLDASEEAYNCSHEVVEQPEFSFTERGDDLFQFTVTPLSPRRNRTTPLEGNSSQPVTGFFVGVPDNIVESAISITLSVDPFNALVTISQDAPSAPGRVPDSYHVHGGTVDPDPTLLLQCASATEAVLVLNESSCEHFLPDRLYNITVEARNRAGGTNSSFKTLSTHDVFRVQTNNCSNPGQINVSCTFAEGADAVGYFTVLYPTTPGGGTQYKSTMGSTGTVNTTIEGLTDVSYMVVVFDIEPSGLPETLAAALPQRVDGVEGGGVGSGHEPAITNSTSTPNVTASTDTGVCVTADSDSVAVIHSTSTTDTQKMMRLFVLPLTGDIVNCTEPLAGGDYHVVVFTNITLFPFHSEVVTAVPLPTTLNPATSTVTDPTAPQPAAVGFVFAIGAIVILTVAVTVVATIIIRDRFRKRAFKVRLQSESSMNTSGEYYQRVEADRRLACDGSVAEDHIPPYEIVSEYNGSELVHVPKVLVYAEPIVKKAVGDAPHPPQQDNEVTYHEVTGTKNAHGIIYALSTVAPSSSTAVVDDEKVLYANVKETQVAETEFKAPTNEVTVTPLLPYPVTHEAVFEILHAIAANWKAIGQQLKINEDLEDEIDTNNEHDEDCLDEVVKFWLMNCDFQHTWAELADAVERAGEQQLSECIRAEKGLSGYVRFEKSPEHVSIQPADSVASMDKMTVTQGIGEGHRDLQQSYSETNPDAKSEVVIPQRYTSASCIPGAVVCRQSVLNKRKSLPEPLQEVVIPMFAIEESVQSTDLPEIKAGPFRFSSPEFSVSASNGIGAEVLQPFFCSAESTGLHISHEGPIQESEQVSKSAVVVSSESDVIESESESVDPQTEIAVQHNNRKVLSGAINNCFAQHLPATYFSKLNHRGKLVTHNW